MALSYLEVIREAFPACVATSSGDPYLYENLEWAGGDALPSQDDLDAWLANKADYTVTKFEFRQLFTLNERVAVDNYASNPNIPANYKAILLTMLKDLELSAEIQLTNPQVAIGMDLLVSIGLLTPERKAAIMSNTPY